MKLTHHAVCSREDKWTSATVARCQQWRLFLVFFLFFFSMVSDSCVSTDARLLGSREECWNCSDRDTPHSGLISVTELRQLKKEWRSKSFIAAPLECPPPPAPPQVPTQRNGPTANFRCWKNVKPAGHRRGGGTHRRAKFDWCSDTDVQPPQKKPKKKTHSRPSPAGCHGDAPHSGSGTVAHHAATIQRIYK